MLKVLKDSDRIANHLRAMADVDLVEQFRASGYYDSIQDVISDGGAVIYMESSLLSFYPVAEAMRQAAEAKHQTRQALVKVGARKSVGGCSLEVVVLCNTLNCEDIRSLQTTICNAIAAGRSVAVLFDSDSIEDDAKGMLWTQVIPAVFSAKRQTGMPLFVLVNDKEDGCIPIESLTMEISTSEDVALMIIGGKERMSQKDIEGSSAIRYAEAVTDRETIGLIKRARRLFSGGFVPFGKRLLRYELPERLWKRRG